MLEVMKQTHIHHMAICLAEMSSSHTGQDPAKGSLLPERSKRRPLICSFFGKCSPNPANKVLCHQQESNVSCKDVFFGGFQRTHRPLHTPVTSANGQAAKGGPRAVGQWECLFHFGKDISKGEMDG